VSEINLHAKKKHRIHGLAMTKECLPNDFVHVFIEINGENKIQINELHIKSLMPYKFDYEFIEWREFLPSDNLGLGTTKNDPIIKYQAVFTKDGHHAAVAQRKEGFDIYYNGNLIDTPMRPGGKRAITIETFTVTYDKIIFEMSKKQKGNNKFRTV
jgi:hypothetical protein